MPTAEKIFGEDVDAGPKSDRIMSLGWSCRPAAGKSESNLLFDNLVVTTSILNLQPVARLVEIRSRPPGFREVASPLGESLSRLANRDGRRRGFRPGPRVVADKQIN